MSDITEDQERLSAIEKRHNDGSPMRYDDEQWLLETLSKTQESFAFWRQSRGELLDRCLKLEKVAEAADSVWKQLELQRMRPYNENELPVKQLNILFQTLKDAGYCG